MQRAAELQAAETEVGEGLTVDEVVALGREVGIPGRYLQQAMLEQAAEVVAPAQAGLLARVVGPSEVAAQRVVVGEPEDAARALIAWFEQNELLVVQRQQPGRVSFEPLRGMQAAIRRGTAAFDSTRPKHMLARSELVSATFTRLESGYCHVGLSARLRKTRSEYLGGAMGAVSSGAAAGIVLAAMNALWAVVVPPLLVGAVIGYFALQRYRPVTERTLLGLERALDYLERGGVKPAHELPPERAPGGGLLELMAGEIRKAIAASTERHRRK
jgi:hypothetical protein